MTITQFGRVELDPNKVPIPASFRSSEPSFRDRLDTVERERLQEPVPQSDVSVERDYDPGEADHAEPSTVDRDAGETGTVKEPTAERPQPLTSRAAPVEPSVPAELKPSDAPRGTDHNRDVRTSRPNSGIDLVPSSAPGPETSDARSVPPTPHAAPTPIVNQAGQAQAQPTAMVERSTAHREQIKTASTQPGYRTLNKATMQMAEAARDSVFRQIALRVNGERGEMRVLLDPPELGKLDMHMVVEKGGTVHLSLIAERPELALMLEKHLGELKQALQSHGLSIGNTEVREQEKQLQDRESRREFSARDEQLDEGEGWMAAAFRRAGYITAEGLDFWV